MPSLLRFLPKSLQHAVRSVKNCIIADAYEYQGSKVPAKKLRTGGENFQDDDIFLSTGEAEARRIVETCSLKISSSILDLGCGFGRLPVGLLRTLGNVATYRGVDVNPVAIDWCTRHITHGHRTFQFFLTDIRNDRYNPSGAERESDAKHLLPFPESTFDCIYLYSVFSHMLPKDVEAYLQEFQRVLKSTGTVFVTTFIEDNVPDFTENPPDYMRQWKGALHCTRYSRSYFETLVAEAGLRIVRLDHRTETNGQSALWLQKQGL